MRIAFDGRALTSPAGGVRRYTRELFEAMPRVGPGVDIIAVGADPATPMPPGVRRAGSGVSLPTNLGWNLTGLPLAARHVSFDVFHAPAYTAPLWGAKPLVVSLHDVSYARHPEWYPYHIDPVRGALYRASAQRADRILTCSSFSRDEIAAAYRIDPSRIDLVPLGVGRQFSPDARVAREAFVLHVGDLHPRRNLAMLLEVVMSLKRSEPSCRGLRLMLAGADLGGLAPLLRQSAGNEDALEYVGRPDDAALVALYRRAGVFAYPSRYEGFGLPLLEAMATGTPVVAAAAGSVPEVVGTAGILLDVDNVRGWREALASVLADSARAGDLAACGLARAAEFTWERTAEATLSCYRRTLA